MHQTTVAVANTTIEHLEQPPAAPTRPAGPALSWETLERQDWHLWILAVLMMFVLGVSLLSFMFPTAFWFAEDLAIRAPQRAFLGFCVLLGLSLVYMVQRQAVARNLRKQLVQALTLAADAEQRALWRAFQSLPEMRQFRDSLAMEFSRISPAHRYLSIAFFDVAHNQTAAMGNVACVLRQMLRRGEGLFRLADTSLGLILPDMSQIEANALVAQAEQNVRLDLPTLTLALTVCSYPEEARNLADLEGKLYSRGL